MIPRRARLFLLGSVALLTASTSVLTASAQITGQHLEDNQVPVTDRPLTLPARHMSAQLDVTFNHYEDDFGIFGTFAANGSNIDISANYGILDDLEVEAVIFSLATKEIAVWPMFLEPIEDADWGMARFGVTVRFLAKEAVEIGGRFRLLVDNNATVGLNGGLPIRVRIPHVFRLDTGFHFTGMIQTQTDDAAFAITDVNTNPSSPEPGIPLRFLFTPLEQFFVGFHTGFGAWDVEEDNSIFLPLGATIGGTIPIKKDLLLDIAGNFLFPFFLRPAFNATDDIVFSELWQVGVQGKVYFEIPK